MHRECAATAMTSPRGAANPANNLRAAFAGPEVFVSMVTFVGLAGALPGDRNAT
jgi:hypothetical protein